MRRTFALLLTLLVSAPASAAVLTHGPITGAVTETSAVVWIRTDAAASVSALYATSPSGPWSAARATSSGDDHTFKATLKRLTASTRYYVGARIDGVSVFPDPKSSFVTAPPRKATSEFTVLVMPDFLNRKKAAGDPPAFASAAAEGASMLFIGGDFDHRHAGNLDGFRRMYRELFDEDTAGLATFVPQILRQMGIAHQWDDHDLSANNCDRTTCLSGPAFAVYREFVPHYPLAAPETSLWQSFRFGQAEFFVLDNRTQRDPITQSPRSMLGADQLAWLLDGLAASTATWKVVFSSVPLNPTVKPTDAWAGYMDERQEILDWIASNAIRGVVVVSGDLHIGGIDDGTTSGVPEMVVPSPDLLSCQSASTLGTWSEGTYGDNTGPCRGYGLLRFGADGSLEFLVKDETGATRLSYSMVP